MSRIRPTIGIAAAGCAAALCVALVWQWRKKHPKNKPTTIAAYEALVGQTPLVQLHRLSQLLQRDIFVKMESMNPGGTGKDRAALGMIHDQAVEKQRILAALGAVVLVVPTASISHPQHYVNLARRVAERAQYHHGIAAIFMNQFENPANVHAFCMSAGTGGTLAGVGRFLKEQTRGQCRVVLVDPPGSVLYHKIQNGIAYAPQQAERSLKRHRYDTIAEGIGLDRLTHNVTVGLDYVDEAIRVTDQEALDMAHWILQHEGLWVGSSSSMNIVGAIRTALSLPVGSRVVTVICDAGSRHVTRFWNREFCQAWGLQWPQEKDGKNDEAAPRVPTCLEPVYDSLKQDER
eukprot:scaffold793_cov161-Amphora_coffeaeformis.AAC.9